MHTSFTYEQQLLASEFEDYLKTRQASTPEFMAFFDGYMLGSDTSEAPQASIEALRLLQAYRQSGHSQAKTNPLHTPALLPDLTILAPFHSDNPCFLPPIFNEEKTTLGIIKDRLHKIYSGSIGYEFLHCNKEIAQHITDSIEKRNTPSKKLNDIQIYEILAKAELFETFLHTRFPGQKRFSLEGLESSLVLIEELVSYSQDLGYKNAFFAMAHRGRLNFLANLFRKPLKDIFYEFSKESEPRLDAGLGDVKYHQGASYTTSEGFNLQLSSNPSHLEAVDPVIQGMSFAHQLIHKEKALTIMIHGDSSFAGQGVVYETLQLSKLEGFDVKGVVHLILNNQIGFTALPKESRITPYASDLAKTFNIPIFHVNSEDIEALQSVAALSLELIHRFNCDVMIDLIGYRKWGHNESDEPVFTQPSLYKILKSKKSPLELFKDSLLEKDRELASKLAAIDTKVSQALKTDFEDTKLAPVSNPSNNSSSIGLKVDQETLKQIGLLLTTMPSTFHIHPKLEKLFAERNKLILQENEIDFALAELLALATILHAGRSVRFIGQDSARGTFSQRHAVLIDQESEQRYTIFEPLLHPQSFCQIINSPLSEFAVLGFEYGFSKISKNSLNVWEAQFGDFANSAQVIIDQFIASGKTKWNDLSTLTLMLPHGYEGQGPEHTSARIERFLELAAENNLRICVPSTPASHFHLLMEQVNASCPLILFTPKALLRFPRCKSPFIDFSKTFEPFIDDLNFNASVIVLCYGKIYYDLQETLTSKRLNHISLIRLEQLYPLNTEHLEALFKKRSNLKKLVLVQDEPRNMGAFAFLKTYFSQLEVISRKPASSPASGFYSIHQKEIQHILTQFETL